MFLVHEIRNIYRNKTPGGSTFSYDKYLFSESVLLTQVVVSGLGTSTASWSVRQGGCEWVGLGRVHGPVSRTGLAAPTTTSAGPRA